MGLLRRNPNKLLNLQFTLDKHTASTVPFRVLSRTNLAYSPVTPALSPYVSEICGLFNSLCALFSTPVVCFQQLADSFCKTPGVGVPLCDAARCTGAQKCLSVSPLPATLTHSLSRKSFSLPLLRKHPGYGCHGCSYSAPICSAILLATRHSSLATFHPPFVFILLRTAFPASPLF